MKPLLRFLFGAILGGAVMAALWTFGWVQAPESVLRRVVIFSTLYPAPRDDVTMQRIPCPPLEPARLYLVCTRGCDGIARVVLVRALEASLLLDQGRVPPESTSVARQRINAVMRRQDLRLDRDGARRMIACYLRLEGLAPDLVLPPGGAEAVEAARAEGPEALEALYDRLVDPDAAARIEVRDAGGLYEGSMLYWDTSRDGNPILRLTIQLAPDGEVRAVSAAPFVPQEAQAPQEPPAE